MVDRDSRFTPVLTNLITDFGITQPEEFSPSNGLHQTNDVSLPFLEGTRITTDDLLTANTAIQQQFSESYIDAVPTELLLNNPKEQDAQVVSVFDRVFTDDIVAGLTSDNPIPTLNALAGSTQFLNAFRAFGTRYQVEAEDLRQEILIKLGRNLHLYDPTRGVFPAWVHTMTNRYCIDILRRRKVRRTINESDFNAAYNNMFAIITSAIVDQDKETDGEERASSIERSNLVRTLLGKIPPKQKAAITACYFDDLTHVEAARNLGIPLGTLKTRLRLGLKNAHKAYARMLEANGTSHVEHELSEDVPVQRSPHFTHVVYSSGINSDL